MGHEELWKLKERTMTGIQVDHERHRGAEHLCCLLIKEAPATNQLVPSPALIIVTMLVPPGSSRGDPASTARTHGVANSS